LTKKDEEEMAKLANWRQEAAGLQTSEASDEEDNYSKSRSIESMSSED